VGKREKKRKKKNTKMQRKKKEIEKRDVVRSRDTQR
jgi:hypothetical protein